MSEAMALAVAQQREIDRLHRQIAGLDAKLTEARHLLRQVFYARCPLGTKFCDELENWKLDDLEQQIHNCINPNPHENQTDSW